MEMTALRATEIFGLYEYVSGWLVQSYEWRQQQLQLAQNALATAAKIVRLM
jgi:hypothetical protein